MVTLRNLGPASLRMLEAAGISTEEDLRALGSVAAYLAVKRTGANASQWSTDNMPGPRAMR